MIGWYKKLCFLSGRIIRKEKNNKKIGGINHIIEIDESKFSKRKYNIGRNVHFPWIVGGIYLTTKDVFFVEVYKRDSTTLKNIILENVELGSTIFIDKWKGYANLSDLGYNHANVNHSTNFIDSITGANIQVIESTWNSYRKLFKARSINSSCYISNLFLRSHVEKKL